MVPLHRFQHISANNVPLHDKQGPILCLLLGLDLVNISTDYEKNVVQFGICDASCDDAEQAIRTFSGTARTIMLVSTLLGRFLFTAFSYAAVVHNVTFSVAHLTSRQLLMYG